jgi:Helix-turn-helix domain
MSDTKSQPSAQEFTRQVFEFLYGVMRDHELPPSAETIAVCLTRYFSRKHGGAAWPALETIAKDTGVNKSTAQRTLLRMGKRGHLHIEPGKQGRGHSSKYWMASGQEKLHQRNFKAEEKLQTAELKVAFEGSKSCTHATEPSYNHFNEPRERAPRARAALSDDWKPSEESMAEVERYFKRWAPEIDQIRRELINYSKSLKRPLPDPDATYVQWIVRKAGELGLRRQNTPAEIVAQMKALGYDFFEEGHPRIMDRRGRIALEHLSLIRKHPVTAKRGRWLKPEDNDNSLSPETGSTVTPAPAETGG